MKKSIVLYAISILLLAAMLIQGCTKDPLPGNFSKPTLNATYKDLSYNSVRLTCNISKTNYNSYGFWYGTKSDLSDKKAVGAILSNDKKSAEATLSQLESGKAYYYQAYVNSGSGMVATSSIKSFVTKVPVSGVSLNEKSISIAVGSSITLTATVSPSNASDKTVTWSSSNTSVATVSNGTVSAKSTGTATITARAGDKTATCTVTVYVAVSGVSLNQTSINLNVGESFTLTATVSPSNATDKNVTWSSSNTSVATVSKGTVKAVGAGNATITAKAGDRSATCTVNVEKKFEPEAVDLGLSVKWATCNVGAKKPEEYGDYFAWGETEPKNDYSWSTYKWCNGTDKSLTKYNTDSSYGTVDTKTILDLSDDAARASWGSSWRMPTRSELQELIDNCTWTWTTVGGKNGYRVTSNMNGNSIFLPAAGCIYGTSFYEVGSRGNYWSSSLDLNFPFSAWELLFYSSLRFMDSTYYYGDRRNFGQPVRPVYGDLISVSRVSLDRTSLTLAVGNSTTLTATVSPSNASDKTVTWSSSNTSVATVSNGTVKAVAAGTATITAMAGSKTATCKITVEVPVSSVSLNYSSLTLTEGDSFTLTATVSPSNATNKTVTWSSSNTSVATVSNGTVKAVSAGTATITAKAGDKTATCTVTVKKKSGPEAVDLGLSVKWASCNVGASSPSDYGSYFAWGETEPKNDYSWQTYRFRVSGNSWDNVTFSKYNTQSGRGTVDNKTVLDLSDDAARANWGGSWRMPTRSEFIELINNCTWTWTTLDGNIGYRMTSKKNGNSIFLPAAGYRFGTFLQDGGSGYYWSSSLISDYPYFALYMSSLSMNYGIYRSSGLLIRPVYGDLIPVSSVSLDRTSLTLDVGNDAILTATIYPINASDKTVIWTSSNTSVATVSNGIVTAKAVGTATITAKAGDKTATCKVTVTISATAVDNLTNYYGKDENNIYWYEDKTLNSSFNGPRLLVNYSNKPRLVSQATDNPNHFILDDVSSPWFDVNPINKLSIAPTKADSTIVFNAIKDYFMKVASINENAVPYLKFISGEGAGIFKYDLVRADKIAFTGLQMAKTNNYINSVGIHRVAPYDNKGIVSIDCAPMVSDYVDAFTNLIQLYNHYVHGDALTLPFYTADDAKYTAANYGIKL